MNAVGSPPSPRIQSTLATRQIIGLSLAGIASSLLTTTFGIFHVQTFLSAYRLPLTSYATGNAIYALFNTANDVGGAWAVDSFASKYGRDRSHMIGFGGCMFAVCFLAPFFRWQPSETTGGGGTSYLDTAHFVFSMSLYDTMYSTMAILLGSIVTDNSELSEAARIRVLAISKFCHMVASFFVAKVGMAVFSVDDLSSFRKFLVFLSILVSILFVVSQSLMTSPQQQTRLQKQQPPAKTKPKQALNIRKVVRDFLRHGNFRTWVVMEMLLESQGNFASSFQMTIVNGLLLETNNNFSRNQCDLLLSCIRPLSQIFGLLLYVPMQKIGYSKVYTRAFQLNLAISLILFVFGSPSSARLVVFFIVVNAVTIHAVQGGFHLAMSDMVIEMKLNQAKEGRFDEPSLSGTFMGANALVCKPMDSFLPIVAAKWLGSSFNDVLTTASLGHNHQRALFYLMIGPAFFFSLIQLRVWRNYTLTKHRMEEMRAELKRLNENRQLERGRNNNRSQSLLQI